MSNIKQSTIDNIVRGGSRNPRIMTLHKIAYAFGMTLSELPWVCHAKMPLGVYTQGQLVHFSMKWENFCVTLFRGICLHSRNVMINAVGILGDDFKEARGFSRRRSSGSGEPPCETLLPPIRSWAESTAGEQFWPQRPAFHGLICDTKKFLFSSPLRSPIFPALQRPYRACVSVSRLRWELPPGQEISAALGRVRVGDDSG